MFVVVYRKYHYFSSASSNLEDTEDPGGGEGVRVGLGPHPYPPGAYKVGVTHEFCPSSPGASHLAAGWGCPAWGERKGGLWLRWEGPSWPTPDVETPPT